jgi:methionyl-tRNA formyltransferase
MIGLLGKGLNFRGWKPLVSILNKKGLPYSYLSAHSEICSQHDLVVSLGYAKIIPEDFLLRPKNGLVVFHSSDLPRGRGWAPLYYTIVNHDSHLVQTLFYADKGVDSGHLIAKARYPVEEWMTLKDLRRIDDRLTCILFKNYIGRLVTQKLSGTRQNEAHATYNAKRTPAHSLIDPQRSLADLYPILRGLPEKLPAFFNHKGITVQINLKIKSQFKFNSKLAEIIDLTSLSPKNV